MNIGRSDHRILIDCTVSEYADLIAAALDLAEHQAQPLQVARPISGLLAAHRAYAEQCADRPGFIDELVGDDAPLVIIGQGIYRKTVPAVTPVRRSSTAELVGAPVAEIAAERVGRSAFCPAHSS